MTDPLRVNRAVAGRGRIVLLIALGLLILGGVIALQLDREPTETLVAEAPVSDPGSHAPGFEATADQRVDSPVAPLAPDDPAPAAAPSVTPAPASPPSPDDGQRFAVHVVDAKGRAVAQARVIVEDMASPDRWVAENAGKLAELMKQPDTQARKDAMLALFATRKTQAVAGSGTPAVYASDEDGWCRFTASRAVTIHAEKDDIGTSGAWESAPRRRSRRASDPPQESAPAGEVRVELELQPQATVSGVVLDRDGRPLPQALVNAKSSYSFSRQKTEARSPDPAQADEDGRFVLQVDAPGSFDVYAQFEDQMTAEVGVMVEPGGRDSITLQVPGAFAIRGRVEGPDGTPVAGGRLTLDRTMSMLRAVSGPDGRFEFLLTDADDYALAAEADGLAQQEPVSITLTAVNPVAEVSVSMIKASTISGVVRWEDGSAAAEARVQASPRARDGQPELSWLNRIHQFQLGPDGSFTLNGIHPEYSYLVSASISEPTHASVSLSDVAPGATGVELVFAQEAVRTYSLAGRVVDARTGSPITEYELVHGSWMRGLQRGETQRVNDGDGRFELAGLSQFEQALQVRAEGYPPKTVGPLTPTDVASEITIRLERLGSLTVHAVDESGADVAGATVHVHLAVSDERPKLFTDWWKGQTGETGRVTWDDAKPGHYCVQAAHGERLSDLTFLTVVGEQPNPVTVRLVSAMDLGTLEVTVLDKGGQPISDARIAIRNMSKLGLGHGPGTSATEEAEATAIGSAPARLTQLLPGIYWVWPDIEDDFITPDWVAVPAAEVTTVQFQTE